ncbi:MAG: 2-C-methyl-D-erythritol 4-phosphate cytidylyltransferase [Sphingobacteriales bacterium]|nr:MAG: 2-C-methyl-D-erythritol 4-phosphate cytidylyltransferase [Sphingobacteriales bacterium]
MEKFAVIVAGGKGLRMGSAIPKQFLPLAGKPVLYHTINAFKMAFPDIQIILVLPQDQISMTQMVLQAFPDRIDLTIVAGGENRFDSVKNGLEAVDEDAIVFVHDGVRPLVSPELIRACYEQAVEKGSAIPAINVADSMRLTEGEESKPVNRDHLRIIQTPQTFQSDILLNAFTQDYDPAFTDEATVAEAFGTKVYLINGERSNIKVTTPEDLIIAEALLTARHHA